MDVQELTAVVAATLCAELLNNEARAFGCGFGWVDAPGTAFTDCITRGVVLSLL